MLVLLEELDGLERGVGAGVAGVEVNLEVLLLDARLLDLDLHVGVAELDVDHDGRLGG